MPGGGPSGDPDQKLCHFQVPAAPSMTVSARPGALVEVVGVAGGGEPKNGSLSPAAFLVGDDRRPPHLPHSPIGDNAEQVEGHGAGRSGLDVGGNRWLQPMTGLPSMGSSGRRRPSSPSSPGRSAARIWAITALAVAPCSMAILRPIRSFAWIAVVPS